jgi:hypothetical protein
VNISPTPYESKRVNERNKRTSRKKTYLHPNQHDDNGNEEKKDIPTD